MMSHALLDGVTALWDAHFGSYWQVRVDRFNAKLGHLTDERFYLQHFHCGPAWINGDLSLMKPGEWVLMIGLNPHLNPADNKIAAERIDDSEGWRHFWRDFNKDRSHWGRWYFPNCGRWASRCIGLDLSAEEAKDFVTERMIFIEFCPYASPRWPSDKAVKWEHWRDLASADEAFHVSRQFRQLLFDLGQPGLVLCNGKFAAWDVKDQQFDVTRMQEIRVPYGEDSGKTFSTWSGIYQPPLGESFPVLGFQHVTSRFGAKKTDALVRFAINVQSQHEHGRRELRNSTHRE